MSSRTGPNSNGHQVIVTFGNPVTVGGVAVTSSDGLATAAQSTTGATVTIDLSTVANAQTLIVKLTNVNDGLAAGDVAIPVGILLGDTNGDRLVNSGDALLTRGRSGQATDLVNYRSDVNTDGA